MYWFRLSFVTAMRNIGDSAGDRSAAPLLRPLKPSERAILEAIRREPGQSRAELAARLGVSPALMSGTVGRFLEEGWISEERHRTPAQRGQPALRTQVRKGAIAGLGVSLSTGGIEVAAMDLGGTLLGSVSLPLGAQDFDAGAPLLVRAVERLLPRAGCWAGITIWTPAMITEAGEITEVTPSQRGVRFQRYKTMLQERFGLPVALENKCPAIDQAMYGSQPEAVVFVLFLDYGVGGSLVDGLRVYRGGFGQAVNVGALLPESGPRPSLPDLARHLGLPGNEPGPELMTALSDPAPDYRLSDWIASRGTALSEPLSIVAQLLNPTEVVLSGLFPEPVLQGLAAKVDLGRYDTPGRLPIAKPRLRTARTVGPGALAASAGAASLYRAISAPTP